MYFWCTRSYRRSTHYFHCIVTVEHKWVVITAVVDKEAFVQEGTSNSIKCKLLFIENARAAMLKSEHSTGLQLERSINKKSIWERHSKQRSQQK